jgi:hypothetical protein
LQYADEQQVPAGVVGVDLGRELAGARLQLLGGDQHLLQLVAHVTFVQRVSPRPSATLP